MKKTIIIGALLVALLAGTLSPLAPSVSAAPAHSHPAFLDKTRFVLHAGIAFYAFHHWVYAPFRAGAFKSGAKDRTKNLIKAGVALLVAYHEGSVAYGIAKKSSSKTLHLVIAPLQALVNAFKSIGTKFKNGTYSDSAVTGLNTSVDGVGSLAGKAGWGIKDIATHIPGL